MELLYSAIIGFVAGAIAKLIMPGKDPGGLVMTTLLGIGGALVASYIGKAMHWYEAGEKAGLIGATVGAIIILVIYRMLRRK
jgi:uncharacterized membrane protein YeaQ/YmgE (transglycosylase-associated protein family)